MHNWLNRPPRTSGDWLVLLGAAAFLLLAAGALPGVLAWAGHAAAVLSPFAGGLVLAYLLDLPTRFFANRLFGGQRAPAIALAYMAFFGAVAALVWLVVPQLLQSLTSFAENLPLYLGNLRSLLLRLQAEYGIDTVLLDNLLQNSGATAQQLVSGMPQLAGAAASLAGNAADLVIALAASVYLLAAKARLLHTLRLVLRALLPAPVAQSLLAVGALFNSTFNGYLGGQLLDALLVGGETFVLMLVLGLNFAPLISVLVAITNIVPMLGPYLGAVPGALLLLLVNPWQAVEFLLVVLVVQQVDGNFIAPRIIGGAIGLSGLGVLLAIVVGGEVAGIPGMVLAVPVLAVLAALARQGLAAACAARGIEIGEGASKAP